MAAMPNAALAYKVLDYINAHPEQWDPAQWVNDCGTAYCFAGWTLALSNHTLLWQAYGTGMTLDGEPVDSFDVADAAARELGIVGVPAGNWMSDESLFEPGNTRDDIGRMVAEVFGPRPEVTA